MMFKNKDIELEKILRDVIKHDFLSLDDYFEKLEIQMAFIKSIKTEKMFDNNIKLLKETIKNFASSISSAKYYLTNSGINISGTSISKKLSIPELHDFYVALARCFTYELFCDFYIKWVDDIGIFIKTRGMKYPRLIKAVNVSGKTARIYQCVLVTDDDIDNNYQNMKRNLSLPSYYPLLKDIEPFDKYEELYKRCLGEKSYKNAFNRFKDGEYKLYFYIINNISQFNKQDEISLI